MVQHGSFIFFPSNLQLKPEYLPLQQVRNIQLQIARNNQLLSYFPDLRLTAYLSFKYITVSLPKLHNPAHKRNTGRGWTRGMDKPIAVQQRREQADATTPLPPRHDTTGGLNISCHLHKADLLHCNVYKFKNRI